MLFQVHRGSFPDTFSCIPSTTPAGIFIETVSSSSIHSKASVLLGLLSIICPEPPQNMTSRCGLHST